jgi:hypothetical protein
MVVSHYENTDSRNQDVVRDKSNGIQIKGEAKRHKQNLEEDERKLKSSIKLFLEVKKKITLYQQKRQVILEKEIMPNLLKELNMIHMLDQDKSRNIISKKKYLQKLFKDKNDAIAFYKKHLHHIK